MPPSMSWDVSGDFASTAALVRKQYFSFSQSELLQCPQELRDRCWEAVTHPNWNEDAATILLFVNRVGWEDRQDTVSAVDLKRLFEKSLIAGSALSEKIVHAMTNIFQPELKSLMRKHGLSDDDMEENPMNVVEECYFDEGKGAPSFLKGALMMAAYRSVAIDNDPSGFLPTLFALREVYGFYRANEQSAGRDSLNWAKPAIEGLAGRIDGPHREVILHCYSAAASAAEEREPATYALGLWEDALGFLTGGGDKQAECHFRIGSLQEKLGRPGEALRAYRAVLLVPEVNDPTVQKLAEMAISTLRAELEDKPEAMQIDSQLAKEFGAAPDFPSSMQAIMKALAKGQNVPDSNFADAISKILEWVNWRKKENLADAKSFSMLVVAIKMLLSMKDSPAGPVSISTLVSEARSLRAIGEVTDQVEFDAILKHLGHER